MKCMYNMPQQMFCLSHLHILSTLSFPPTPSPFWLLFHSSHFCPPPRLSCLLGSPFSILYRFSLFLVRLSLSSLPLPFFLSLPLTSSSSLSPLPSSLPLLSASHPEGIYERRGRREGERERKKKDTCVPYFMRVWES